LEEAAVTPVGALEEAAGVAVFTSLVVVAAVGGAGL
jgi:hypothetical protein